MMAANVVNQISKDMGVELPFDADKFNKHYQRQLAMPYTIQSALSPEQIAKFDGRGFVAETKADDLHENQR